MLHHPLERIQAPQVVRESVIFHQTPIFRLVVGDDGEITLHRQFLPMSRFALALIPLAFLLNDAVRDSKSNASIDTPLRMGSLGVVAERLDVVAEEASTLMKVFF
jgi:hypothetical protein